MWVIRQAISKFVYVVELLILVRIIMSFLIRDPYNQIYRFVHQVTEPILAPFRNLIDKLGINTGMFDFSPILAIFALRILAFLLTSILVF